MTQVISAVLLLGVICTGVAYLLYFQLVDALGAPSALTVTFMVPVFGILWGRLILNEPISWHTITGGILVLSGTALVTGLVTGFSIKTLLYRAKINNVR
ncbi:MAG: EamA family transporter [Endozoicomonas sp.]